MSRMITLRACLVAGCAALVVALTGCTGPATEAHDPGPARLQLDLPVVPHGTDAGLITGPATLDGAPTMEARA